MESPSITSLGLSRAREAEQRDVLGGDPTRYYLRAQRIVWGVNQPDFVRVDVEAKLKRLLRDYGAVPAAQLVSAYVLRDRDRGTADRALELARKACHEGHPHAYLLPTDAEWAGDVPEQTLRCVIPDRVYSAGSYVPLANSSLPSLSRATIVRTEAGDLVMINPVPLSPVVRAQIDSLGPTRAFAVQGKTHSSHVEETQRAFPNARALGTRGHLQHDPAIHLRFDDVLEDPGALPEEFAVIPIEGQKLMQEVALVHRPTGLLILQDFVCASTADMGDLAFFNRLYNHAFGLCNRVGFLGYQLFTSNDLGALQRSLRTLRDVGYRRAIGAHWGLLEGDVLKELDAALDWLQTLPKSEHRKMLLRYFVRQPGFLRDVIRSLIRSAKRT